MNQILEQTDRSMPKPRVMPLNMARSRPIVLVLEDSEDDFYLLERAFRKLDACADLVHIADGAEIIRYLTEAKQTTQSLPSVLFLDLKVPGVSGLEVLKWLRSDPVLKLLPVNILSSSSEPSDIQTAFELGANAFTVKPMNLEEYDDAVATLCKFWLQLSQCPRFTA